MAVERRRHRLGGRGASRSAALQKRVDEMGPVNLVAIEEYEETEQRYQFLTTQHDDLVKAKAQLLEVINRINIQTREMFTETFNKIRDNFRAMFTEIFGGGKADLILVDEGDVLESGIDIVARPPGKQLQSICLLSGGEQTMTAVALLFSIYQVKPSPFCVLDELDAPLDESNINRFVRILAAVPGPFAVHHHHAQQAHHRHGRRPLRRHHAGTRHQQDRQREVPQIRRRRDRPPSATARPASRSPSRGRRRRRAAYP